MTPSRRTPEEQIEAHVKGDGRRWLMLTWSVIFAYIIGAVLSVVLYALVIRVQHNAGRVEDATCVIVKLIEDGTDRERSLVRTGKQSIHLKQGVPERAVRLRSLKAHERSLKVGVRLSHDLRSFVTCPPHVPALSLKSP